MATTATDLVTPENLTRDALKAFFDDASMNTGIDGDGDLFVKESGLTIFVVVHPSADSIRFFAPYGFRQGVDQIAKIVFANHVNNGFRTLRARVNDHGQLIFEYEIRVKGGATRRAILYALKWFAETPPLAIEKYGRDLIA